MIKPYVIQSQLSMELDRAKAIIATIKGWKKLKELESLIAFVQKHKLSVYTCDLYRKKWCILLSKEYNGVDAWCYGKTWTAAVRKAKRVIKKGKK